MGWEYHYSIEDYHGDSYSDAVQIITDIHYDLDDDDDLQWLAEKCARHYWHRDGYLDNQDWTNGNAGLKVWIWKTPEKRIGYSVWVDMTPHFRAFRAD
jgi:hypothetical protein